MQVVEFEVDLISSRTKEALRRRKDEGLPLGRQIVDVDIETAIELLETEDLPKASVCKMIGTNTGTLNKKLREAGRADLVGEPTRKAESKGMPKKSARVKYSGVSEGIGERRALDSDVQEHSPGNRSGGEP